jgi:hypothetical protein
MNENNDKSETALEVISGKTNYKIKKGKKTKFAAESEAAETAADTVAVETLMGNLTVKEIPNDLERMNLPVLVKADQIPTGATVSGKLVRLVPNFTGKDDLRNSNCIWLENNGTEFMLPMTGQIKKAFEPFLDMEQVEEKDSRGKKVITEKLTLHKDAVGDEFFFTRLPDGKSKNYGKRMFLFDIKRRRAVKSK